MEPWVDESLATYGAVVACRSPRSGCQEASLVWDSPAWQRWDAARWQSASRNTYQLGEDWQLVYIRGLGFWRYLSRRSDIEPIIAEFVETWRWRVATGDALLDFLRERMPWRRVDEAVVRYLDPRRRPPQ